MFATTRNWSADLLIGSNRTLFQRADQEIGAPLALPAQGLKVRELARRILTPMEVSAFNR